MATSLAFFLMMLGCSEVEPILGEQTGNEISLSVQMPSDETTRVSLSEVQNTKNLTARWQDGDDVQIFVTQDDVVSDVGKVKVSNITNDGKQATISFSLPEEIDRTKPYTVYNLTGIDGTVYKNDDGIWYVRCMAELQRSPLSQFKAPMYAEVSMENNLTPIISFKHFGTYELLHVKNATKQSVSIAHRGFDVQLPWYQAVADHVNPADGNKPVDPSGEWDGDWSSSAQDIAAESEEVFISWYIPSGFSISDARLLATVDGKKISSSNTFSSNVQIQRGRAYHMYATWDGTELKFDADGSDVSPGEAIDLGLPSGTLWASCNVGATKPEEYGDYFAWGETKGYNSGKTTFNWDTYFDSSFNKYNLSGGLTELALEDDAAYVNWGSNWRMPNLEQIQELIDNCNWEWTTLNGVYGQKATSKKNGNSIFLPAAGYRYGASLYNAGSWGYYWSRTLYTYSALHAYYLNFFSGYVDWDSSSRYRGRSVRPVRR